MKAGIQLFGCAEEFRKDPEKFMQELAKIGYTEIEPCILFGGQPFFRAWTIEEAIDFKAMADKIGLEINSAHIFCKDLSLYEEKIIEMAQKLNIKAYVAHTPKDEKAAAALIKLAETLKGIGVKLWLHNDKGDFTPENIENVKNFLNSSDNIWLQLDTGWAVYDGADLETLITDPTYRFGSLHFKDMAWGYENKEGDAIFALLGEGITETGHLLRKAAGAPVILDQDCIFTDPLTDFKASYIEMEKALRQNDADPRDAQISYLETYDLATGERKVLREFDHTVEAPNWSMDGKFLVYNDKGHIWKYIFETGEIEMLDTGDACKCNNDHVLSVDGKYICVSSNTAENTGFASNVFAVPIEGGEARRITKNSPSFLHGISPDGKTLAYCAFRNMEKGGDIYAIPFEGGDEVQLTDCEGLNDGPEYSRDGKTIWFNSVRTGLMQAFKMDVDGKNQTQMTFDENLNTWFPHISPDGKKVLLICYHVGDLKPGEHLANKNVILRLMDADGKNIKTIAHFFGGQGTVNVNSWAPDSTKFAFVSYGLK